MRGDARRAVYDSGPACTRAGVDPRLIPDWIIALGLNSFPEGLVVVVPRSAILVVEREGIVLIPVAMTAYRVAPIAVVVVQAVVRSRMHPLGLPRGSPPEMRRQPARRQRLKGAENPLVSPAYADC